MSEEARWAARIKELEARLDAVCAAARGDGSLAEGIISAQRAHADTIERARMLREERDEAREAFVAQGLAHDSAVAELRNVRMSAKATQEQRDSAQDELDDALRTIRTLERVAREHVCPPVHGDTCVNRALYDAQSTEATRLRSILQSIADALKTGAR